MTVFLNFLSNNQDHSLPGMEVCEAICNSSLLQVEREMPKG